MTLQSVAERIRAAANGLRHPDNQNVKIASFEILKALESDPEFTAPERLKEAERQLAEAREKLEIVKQLAQKWMDEDAQTHPDAIIKRTGSGYYGSFLLELIGVPNVANGTDARSSQEREGENPSLPSKQFGARRALEEKP